MAMIETNLNKKDKMTIAIFLFIAVIFMFGWYAIRPTILKIRDLNDQISQAQIKAEEYKSKIIGLSSAEAVFNRAVEDINDKINKMFDLHLAKDNRLPPNEEAARKEWNKLRNDWLSKNCHRKFKNEYYEALGDLPEIARKRLSEINNAIF